MPVLGTGASEDDCFININNIINNLIIFYDDELSVTSSRFIFRLSYMFNLTKFPLYLIVRLFLSLFLCRKSAKSYALTSFSDLVQSLDNSKNNNFAFGTLPYLSDSQLENLVMNSIDSFFQHQPSCTFYLFSGYNFTQLSKFVSQTNKLVMNGYNLRVIYTSFLQSLIFTNNSIIPLISSNNLHYYLLYLYGGTYVNLDTMPVFLRSFPKGELIEFVNDAKSIGFIKLSPKRYFLLDFLKENTNNTNLVVSGVLVVSYLFIYDTSNLFLLS